MAKLIFHTHGRFYYAFYNAVGWKLFKAIYLPARRGWYHWLVLAITMAIFLPVPLSFLLLLDESLKRHIAQVSTWLNLILAIPYFWSSIYCIHKEHSALLKKYGVRGFKVLQPFGMWRDFLHFHWFVEFLKNSPEGLPTKEQTESCMEFLSLTYSKPKLLDFLKHPQFLAVEAILIFILQHQIRTIMDVAGNHSMPKLLVIWIWIASVMFVIYLQFFGFVERRWRFERCLRWYVLWLREIDE